MGTHNIRKDFSAATLRSLLDYNSITGKFYVVRGRYFGMEVGSVNARGYIRIHVLGRYYLAHRLAWLYVHGEWPPIYIDHINGVPTDNRIANLRCVTPQENNWNKPHHRERAVRRNGMAMITAVTKRAFNVNSLSPLPLGENGGGLTLDNVPSSCEAAATIVSSNSCGGVESRHASRRITGRGAKPTRLPEGFDSPVTWIAGVAPGPQDFISVPGGLPGRQAVVISARVEHGHGAATATNFDPGPCGFDFADFTPDAVYAQREGDQVNSDYRQQQNIKHRSSPLTG